MYSPMYVGGVRGLSHASHALHSEKSAERSSGGGSEGIKKDFSTVGLGGIGQLSSRGTLLPDLGTFLADSNCLVMHIQ